MEHHTKDKGDLGVLKAQVDLAEQGFMVLIPLTEHSAFDLVAYKDGAFKRVQVKYRKVSNGKLNVSFRSSWSDKHGNHTKPIDKNQIDLFCVYCPDLDECYYFDPSKFAKSLTLRVEPSKNNQQSNVHLAADYRKVP